LIFFAQPVTATVFRFAVVLFSLIGFAIFSLGLLLVPEIAGAFALITTVSLSSETTAANTKIKRTPSALN
jgi:hypothetical protein